jgi:hypothetical protein
MEFKTAWRWFRAHCLPATKQDLKEMEHHMATKVIDLAATLTALGAQLDKAKTEIVTEIQALKTALDTAEIPAEAQASLDKLTTLAQALDDLNPDAAAPQS